MQCMGFLDLVLPNRCAVCRNEVPGRRPACSECWSLLYGTRIRPNRGFGASAFGNARCLRCFGQRQSDGRCAFCDGRYVFFDSHRSLFAWSPYWRRAVRTWKFSGERTVRLLFQGALRRTVAQTGPFEAIAYISTPFRRRSRSFEPVRDLLALVPTRGRAGKGQPEGLPMRKVSRVRQSSKAYQDRFLQVRDSFGMKRAAETPGSVLFLDDLFTTGATANEAARVLRGAGAKKIHVISMVIREDLDFS